MFPREMTSARVSENIEPIWHGPCLNPNVHAKYSRRCHMKCPLLWASHMAISRTAVVDRPSTDFRQHIATISSGRFDWPSSSGVIFKRCSATFKFSNPPGDSRIRWGIVPINVYQTFISMLFASCFSNVKNLIAVQYSDLEISSIL